MAYIPQCELSSIIIITMPLAFSLIDILRTDVKQIETHHHQHVVPYVETAVPRRRAPGRQHRMFDPTADAIFVFDTKVDVGIDAPFLLAGRRVSVYSGISLTLILEQVVHFPELHLFDGSI